MILYLIHLGSVILGAGVTTVLVWKVAVYPEQFNRVERIGMALVGGTMVLRAPSIMVSPDTTPFSDWSTCAMTLGLLMMHGGRLIRLRRHARANKRMGEAWKMKG